MVVGLCFRDQKNNMFNKMKNIWPSQSSKCVKRAQGGVVPADSVDPNAVLNDDNYDEFVQDVLVTHNYYRGLHGVPALELKNEISEYSKNWAKVLVQEKQMRHSQKSDRPNYGENIYYFSGKYIHGKEVVKSWYNESIDHNYNYGKEPNNLKAGHFTQVVWRNSTYLGVGAMVWDKGLFVVCNYEPPGNVTGKFVENVPPPIN